MLYLILEVENLEAKRQTHGNMGTPLKILAGPPRFMAEQSRATSKMVRQIAVDKGKDINETQAMCLSFFLKKNKNATHKGRKNGKNATHALRKQIEYIPDAAR